MAIIKFNKMSDGEKALKSLKDFTIDGSTLIMQWADGEKERLGISEDQSPKLQVDGIPKDCEEP